MNPQLSHSDYAVMVIYLLIVVAIGYVCSRRKETNTEDFLLGGRKMPWFVIGISYFISLLSTISLVTSPGEAYNHGISFMAMGLIYPFFSLGAFMIFMRFYFRVQTFTPYTYLENRFDVRVRVLGSVLFMLMRLMYLAIVLYSCAKVFEGAAGWPATRSIILVGTIGILYTTMGGLRAVVWTDLVQFVILVGGLGLVVWVCVHQVPGGIVEIVRYSFEHERGFEYFKDPRFYSLSPFIRLNLWVLLFSSMSNAIFENSADQLSIQRLLSTSSYRQARKSLLTYIGISVPFGVVIYGVGLAMFTYYSHHPATNVEVTGDTALFHFISTQLPKPVPGLIISAMLAAVMSTLDSGINSLATVFTKDFYLRLLRPQASETQQVRLSRVMTVLIGLLAVATSLTIANVNKSVGQKMIEVSSLWGAFFNVLWPIFLLGVTSPKIRANQILILTVLSWLITVAMMIWYLISKGSQRELSFMLISVPGAVFMIVGGYLWACFTPPAPAEKIKHLTLTRE